MPDDARTSPISRIGRSRRYPVADGGDVARRRDLEAVLRRSGVPYPPCSAATRMEINESPQDGAGTVVELDRKVGEAIDIYVNNRLVARGEVVLVMRMAWGDHDGNRQGGAIA